MLALKESQWNSLRGRKKLLTIFPLSRRFFLDIIAAQFYTFNNCNVFIADIDATHRKGRIGKWQLRKQPRRQPRKHPRRRRQRRPRRRSSSGLPTQKATLRGTHKASPSVFVREDIHSDESHIQVRIDWNDAAKMDCPELG